MGTLGSFLSVLPELGMRDLWNVYGTHFDEITVTLFQRARLMPGFGRVLPILSREEIVDRGRSWRALVRTAIFDGDWRPILEARRLQARLYARGGVPFGEWLEVLTHFHSLMAALLVESLANDPARLSRAMLASVRYVHLTTNAVAEAYLANQPDRDRSGPHVACSEPLN